MEPFKNCTASNSHLDRRLNGAVGPLAASALAFRFDCNFRGAYPHQRPPAQQVLRRQAFEAARFAEKCAGMGHGSELSLRWTRTQEGQVIRLRLQRSLKTFLNEPSLETRAEVSSEPTELISVLSTIEPARGEWPHGGAASVWALTFLTDVESAALRDSQALTVAQVPHSSELGLSAGASHYAAKNNEVPTHD